MRNLAEEAFSCTGTFRNLRCHVTKNIEILGPEKGGTPPVSLSTDLKRTLPSSNLTFETNKPVVTLLPKLVLTLEFDREAKGMDLDIFGDFVFHFCEWICTESKKSKFLKSHQK